MSLITTRPPSIRRPALAEDSEGSAGPNCESALGDGSTSAETPASARKAVFTVETTPAFDSIVSMVSEYLNAEDVCQLMSCTRSWRELDIRFAFPYLHRITFRDIEGITSVGSSTWSRSSSPESLRCIERLDISGYSPPRTSARSSPVRPRRQSRRQSGTTTTVESPVPGGRNVTREEWVSGFVHSTTALRRLRSLALGPMMPKWMLRTCLAGVAGWVPVAAARPSRLAALSLRGIEKCDDGLLSCVQHAPSLRAIDLSGCWRVSPVGVAALAKACPRVEKALLGGVCKVNDAVLASLPTAWPDLTALELSCEMGGFSAVSLGGLLASHPALAAVRLCRMGASFTGEEGWRAVLAAAAPLLVRSRLRVLHFGPGCHGLSPALLEWYQGICKQEDMGGEEGGQAVPLPRLSFHGCTGMQDCGLWLWKEL